MTGPGQRIGVPKSRRAAIRWPWYLLAVAATLTASLLWLFVFAQFRRAAIVTVPSDVLPVPTSVRPADPVRAVLYDDLQNRRAVCEGGYYARVLDDAAGRHHAVQVRVDDAPVPCP